ncbi:MAG: sugar porter family MFS transporter [Gemmatimonadota bacterium]
MTAASPPGNAGGFRWTYVFGALGGMLFGYDTGIIAGAILFIRQDLNLSPLAEGLVVSSLLLGALVGAAASGYLSDRLGRRRLLLLAGAVFTVGALGAALSPDANVLMGFRLLLGLAVGVASVMVPLYLAEMAPTRIRGALTSLNQLMIAVGIFIAYLTAFLLSGAGAWRVMLGLAAVPSLLMLAGMWFQDESPRWLVVHGHDDEARAVLARTRTPDEVEHEIAEMHRAEEADRMSLGELLRARWLRRNLVFAGVLAVFQQLIGINTIVYYAPTILKAAGFGNSAAIFNSVGLGMLSIIMTVVAARVVDRVGRKPLLLWGLVGMVASMAVLGVVFFSAALDTIAGKAIAVVCLAIFKAAFSLSWGPMLGVVLPELLPLRARGTVMGGAIFLNWGTNFLVSLLFPVLLVAGAGAVFEIFAGAGVLAFVLTAWLFRETTGRSLEELELAQRAAG